MPNQRFLCITEQRWVWKLDLDNFKTGYLLLLDGDLLINECLKSLAALDLQGLCIGSAPILITFMFFSWFSSQSLISSSAQAYVINRPLMGWKQISKYFSFFFLKAIECIKLSYDQKHDNKAEKELSWSGKTD